MSKLKRKSGFVAIIGRPNAGKSTLINLVLDAKVSIVTSKAQTTRERVLGILTAPQGQIVFVDTPGIHRAREGGINAFMVQEAREALDAPNAVWYLVDPRSALEHEEAVLDLLAPLQGSGIPVFLLFNKVDIIGKEGVTATSEEAIAALEETLLTEMKSRGIQVQASLRISAKKNSGISELLEKTWSLLSPGEFFFPDEDQISDRPTRFFVGEKVREQLFLKLGDELPYSCAVEIERFDEKTRPPRIEAIIYVERDSQKGMVVGKGGHKIKEIGQAARQEVEDFLGHTVFLGLRVKLLKDWTRDVEALKRMGYIVPQQRKKTS